MNRNQLITNLICIIIWCTPSHTISQSNPFSQHRLSTPLPLLTTSLDWQYNAYIHSITVDQTTALIKQNDGSWLTLKRGDRIEKPPYEVVNITPRSITLVTISTTHPLKTVILFNQLSKKE